MYQAEVQIDKIKEYFHSLAIDIGLDSILKKFILNAKSANVLLSFEVKDEKVLNNLNSSIDVANFPVDGVQEVRTPYREFVYYLNRKIKDASECSFLFEDMVIKPHEHISSVGRDNSFIYNNVTYFWLDKYIAEQEYVDKIIKTHSLFRYVGMCFKCNKEQIISALDQKNEKIIEEMIDEVYLGTYDGEGIAIIK